MYRGSLHARVADEVAEITTITTRADVSDNLDGKYFILYSAKDETLYHVWFNTSGGSAVDPAPVGSTPIEVAIATNATAIAVADAAETAINAIGDFSAPTDGDDDIVITNAATGASTDASDGDTGFTPFVISPQGVSGDVTVAQPLKMHGYIILSNGSADATLNVWLGDKTGNPVWSDTVIGADKAKPVDFSVSMQIGGLVATVIFEVVGDGGSAFIRYD